MKIVSSDTCRKTEFSDILGGEVFRDSCGNILMKTNASERNNAVDLSDGEFFDVSYNEEVERLECELVLYN